MWHHLRRATHQCPLICSCLATPVPHCCNVERWSDAGAVIYAKGCARVSLGPLRPSRTVIPLPASRHGMRHATSPSHPPKFGLGTSQSAQGSHRFQASARRPAPAHDPSSRCVLADTEFKPGPLRRDQHLRATFPGTATARSLPCGGLFWNALPRLSRLADIGRGSEAVERPAGSATAGRNVLLT